jgi:hypothetical protein
MTAAADLLARCRALGIALAAGPDGSLDWEADADPPPGLLQALAEHKGELLALLAMATGPAVALTPTDDTTLARFLECDQGLPPGSLVLCPAPRGCRGCAWCRPGGRD